MTIRIHPTALIDGTADLGSDVTVGAYTIIGANVTIGDGTRIGSHCIVGGDLYTDAAHIPPSSIGRDSTIRSHTVIYPDVAVGDDFRTGHRVTIREGARIGQDVQIGTLSDLQGRHTIGNHVRFHSNVHICQHATVEDYVWIFPYTVLTNDPHPPSDTCTVGPTVRHHAIIATQCTVLPGIDVGAESMVGASSLVVKDVEPGTVVAGVPAKMRGMLADIQCKEGLLDAPYPWKDRFDRGYVFRVS